MDTYKISNLAKKWEILYNIPQDVSIQFLNCNSELKVVKNATTGDELSQLEIVNRLRSLLNIKLR